MSYPLINGTTINGEEAQGSLTIGIDLAKAGIPKAVVAARAVGVVGLSLGQAMVRAALLPPGVDLATSGQHIAKFNTSLKPPGLDLVRTMPAAVILKPRAPGLLALEFGALKVQLGIDVALDLAGLELARGGLHSALAGQQGSNVVVQARSARALQMGSPRAALAAIQVTAPGKTALSLGVPGVRSDLLASGGYPLEPGVPQLRAVAAAPGRRALDLGEPAVVLQMSVGGLDLARTGRPSLRSSAVLLEAAGAVALQLGMPSVGALTVRARPGFALELGSLSVLRESTC